MSCNMSQEKTYLCHHKSLTICQGLGWVSCFPHNISGGKKSTGLWGWCSRSVTQSIYIASLNEMLSVLLPSGSDPGSYGGYACLWTYNTCPMYTVLELYTNFSQLTSPTPSGECLPHLCLNPLHHICLR